MPSFHNGSVEIAYLDEGEGDPIVLVHGFASTKNVNWVYPAWVSTLTRAGRRVIAVGTTSLRLLESSGLQPFSGSTDIFITPGHRFTTVDALITNFHLPRSTLFMLVSAFAGLERMKQADGQG